MKTPENWNDIYRGICFNDPAVHGQLLPNPQNTAFIKAVQDDALASRDQEVQGLREALLIIRTFLEETDDYKYPILESVCSRALSDSPVPTGLVRREVADKLVDFLNEFKICRVFSVEDYEKAQELIALHAEETK